MKCLVHKPLLVFSNGAKFQVLLSKPIYISFCNYCYRWQMIGTLVQKTIFIF